MEKGDKGSTLIRMGVSGWMFLLVPAYPGCPGQTAVKWLLLVVVVVVTCPYKCESYKYTAETALDSNSLFVTGMASVLWCCLLGCNPVVCKYLLFNFWRFRFWEPDLKWNDWKLVWLKQRNAVAGCSKSTVPWPKMSVKLRHLLPYWSMSNYSFYR